MKKIFCIIFSLYILQSSFAVPLRTVLLELNQNEDIYWGEYLSNVKISGYKYICILENTKTKEFTLVWNGERKIVSDDCIWLSYIDPNDFKKCIFTYKVGDNEYLQFEDRTFGPYEYVYIKGCYPMMSSDWTSCNTNYINRCEFVFKQMGEYYVHDNDGTIYKESDGKFEFISPNKKHHAKLSKDKRVMTIDGINYPLPIPNNANVDKANAKVCLFNDGTCYFSQYDSENIEELCYYITPDRIEIINTEKDYFDLDSHTIKSQSVLSYYNEPFRSDGYTEFLLQDKDKKHVFMAKWNYDYVLIDGKKYGNKCPIEAFYDENDNSFGWVVIEKSEIVLYTLKL